MAIACKYCILTKGLKGSEIASLPQTDEEFANHVEKEHHIPVRRNGETDKETMERFNRENPEAGGPNCKCPSCQVLRQIRRDPTPKEIEEAVADRLAQGIDAAYENAREAGRITF